MAPGVTAGPATRRRGRTLLQVLAVCCVSAGVGLFVARGLVRPPWHHTLDLRVYRGAVRWWLQGRPLYAFLRPHTSLGFTYPPFAVLCLLPVALGTEATATVLITVASAAALLVTTAWLVASPARRRGRPVGFAVALAVPLALLLDPVRETLGWGQVGLLLALLVLADVRALQRGRRWAGVGIGLAAAIKATPARFVGYLLVSGRWRPSPRARPGPGRDRAGLRGGPVGVGRVLDLRAVADRPGRQPGAHQPPPGPWRSPPGRRPRSWAPRSACRWSGASPGTPCTAGTAWPGSSGSTPTR